MVLSARGRAAEENFLSGYNCAQAVVCAFADEIGLSVDAAARMASGLGGGVGRLREVCGCVSGMALVYGMLRGYSAPGEAGQADKARLYADIQEMARRFRAEAGSIVCRELLGPEAAQTSPVPAQRTAQYYESRPCPRLAGLAGTVLEGYLAEAREKQPQGL